MSAITARLFVFFQWVLPKYFVTSIVFHLARIRNVAVKNFLINRFVSAYKVNIGELDKPVPEGYESFNAFFTRDLSPGARPLDDTPDAIVAPVDGTVSVAAAIENDMLIQAKGMRYSLDQLLATDLPEAGAFVGGRFTTIYLAPYNYHRVHAPMAGVLRAARYVPGDLFSVNAATASLLPGLFARNERLVCHFETDNGPYVLIFVGALNVGSITTPWTSDIRPQKRGVVVDCELSEKNASRNVATGELLGWFNMGSTVILLLPDGRGEWLETLQTGKTLRMGEAIGQLS